MQLHFRSGVLSIFFLLSSVSQAAILVAPKEKETFSTTERSQIIQEIKKASGIQAEYIAESPVEIIKANLKEAGVSDFEIREVPDTLYDLSVILHVLQTFEMPRVSMEEFQTEQYFTVAAKLIPELRETHLETLETILSEFRQMSRSDVRDLPSQGGRPQGASQLLFESIVKSSQTDFFSRVIELEEKAIQKGHFLLWRGTNGYTVEKEGQEFVYLDYPVRSWSPLFDPAACSIIDGKDGVLMPLSYGQTLMGGALFDGFSRPTKSASSYVYYQNHFNFLYALSIPRKVFFENKELFDVAYQPAEFAVLSGGDHFHPWVSQTHGSESALNFFDRALRFSKLLRDHCVIIHNNSEQRNEHFLNNYLRLVSRLENSLDALKASFTSEMIFEAIEEADLLLTRTLLKTSPELVRKNGLTPEQFARKKLSELESKMKEKSKKLNTSFVPRLDVSSDSDSDPITPHNIFLRIHQLKEILALFESNDSK